jgi:hypothetical protein
MALPALSSLIDSKFFGSSADPFNNALASTHHKMSASLTNKLVGLSHCF